MNRGPFPSLGENLGIYCRIKESTEIQEMRSPTHRPDGMYLFIGIFIYFRPNIGLIK